MMKSEHNSFPYNDTEWNNIVNDAFTSDAQPHVFSERYARRKQQMLHQMEESPMRSHKFHMKKSMTALVAVAAAVVILPTAVYASTQIRGYFQTKDGVYQQEVVIPKAKAFRIRSWHYRSAGCRREWRSIPAAESTEMQTAAA
ncbi:MAG: hypothetical protein ACLR1R_02795 [Ruminococcus callidus]